MTGTVALGLGTRLRGQGFKLGLAAGLALPVIVLLVLSLLPRGGSTDATVPPEIAAQREALAAFEDALAPITETGAATVVYGMRPGINDIYDERFDADTLAGMAAGWVEATADVRDRFRGVEVPGFMGEVGGLYWDAFDAYHETARTLLAAANASGDERLELITRAAEHGTRADGLYDAARSGLDAHRERLGVSPPRAGE